MIRESIECSDPLNTETDTDADADWSGETLRVALSPGASRLPASPGDHAGRPASDVRRISRTLARTPPPTISSGNRGTAITELAWRSRTRGSFLILGLAFAAWSCTDPMEPLLQDASGGITTVSDQSTRSFSLSARGLDRPSRVQFEIGDSFFNRNWVSAPSSTTARDGLGPRFNAAACSSCHHRDGRGKPPDEDHPDQAGLLHRLSWLSDGKFGPHPELGSQLLDRELPGLESSGRFHVDYEPIPGRFADGSSYELVRPLWIPDETLSRRLGELATEGEKQFAHSARIAPPMIGLGLLEAIPLETILAQADPDDRDNDGISGRPHWVQGPSGGRRLGRFGWKSAVPTVREQILMALHADMGLTSREFPDDLCAASDDACVAAGVLSRSFQEEGVDVPEERVDQLAFYSRTLAVPARRDLSDPEVRRGAKAFVDFGCSTCHLPSVVTGDHPIAVLAGQEIHPYTDLLLHDLGEGLADDRPDGDASGQEWRTAPLWGIGLTSVVSGHSRFLHDGRARNLEEAVLWHGGEASRARDQFIGANASRRQALVAFLNSL